MSKVHPLLGKRILAIFAHPDDEAYLVSGTANSNQKAGGKTSIICATLGEKGSSHLQKKISPAKLKALRKMELLAATKHANATKLYILNFPDGQVHQYQKKFMVQCDQVLKKELSEVIISFGPDGYTGHRDHIACWKVASALAKKYRMPLYIATVPPKLINHMHKWLMPKRVNPHYDDICDYCRPTVKIPTSPGFKRRVLSHYPSQVDLKNPYGDAPASAVKELFAAEYFARIV